MEEIHEKTRFEGEVKAKMDAGKFFEQRMLKNIMADDVEEIKSCLAEGCPLMWNRNMSGAMWACFYGSEKATEFFATLCEIDGKCRPQGWTAIAIACGRGHLGCVRRMLGAGASLRVKDVRGMPPWHQAANSGKLEVLEFLGTVGMRLKDIDERDKRGLSAFDMAVEKNLPNVAELIGQIRSEVEARELAKTSRSVARSSWSRRV